VKKASPPASTRDPVSVQTPAQKKEKLNKDVSDLSMSKNGSLSKCNGHPIFEGPTNGSGLPSGWKYLSQDLLHGAWEILNGNGKHLGEFKFDSVTKNWSRTPKGAADSTGKHDIKTKC
jgi:hypothetical protein